LTRASRDLPISRRPSSERVIRVNSDAEGTGRAEKSRPRLRFPSKPSRTDFRKTDSGARTLPFRQFQALLTFFSKFFSPFLRSTSSLSVSPRYLALDEVYHPLGLNSQTTRLVERRMTCRTGAGDAYGVLTLYDVPFEVTWSLVRDGPSTFDLVKLQFERLLLALRPKRRF